MIVIGSVAPIAAQEAETRQRQLPEGVLSIRGVRPDMSNAQLLELGLQALDARALEEAEELLRYIIGQEPQNLTAHNRLGYVFELQLIEARARAADDPGRVGDRVAQLQRAVVDQYLQAAELARNQGYFGSAEELYHRVTRYAATNPQVQLGLARVYAAQEQHLQAIERYKDYIKSDEGRTDSQAHLELGREYRLRRHMGLAITTLDTARQLNPENPEIYLEQAYAYMQNDRYTAASQAARTALDKAALRPDLHRFVNVYAEVLMAQGDAEEADRQVRRAIELAQTALRRSPDDPRLLRSLVRYFETRRRVLRTLLRNQPDSVALRMELARGIEQEASANRALALHEALSILPFPEGPNRENVELLEMHARLHMAVYRFHIAAEVCRRLLSIDPDNRVAREIMENLPPELRGGPDGEPEASAGGDLPGT